MKISTQQIVNKLIPLMEIRMIYQSKVNQGLYSKSVFIIILDKDCASLSSEILTTVDKIFWEETDSLYRVFSLGYVRKQFDKENLFFIDALRKENLIYRVLRSQLSNLDSKTT